MQLVFLTYDKISSYSPRGVMDNTEDSGSSAGGSIPSEGAKFKRETLYLLQGFSLTTNNLLICKEMTSKNRHNFVKK